MKVGRKADAPTGQDETGKGRAAPARGRGKDNSGRKRRTTDGPTRKRGPSDGTARGARTRAAASAPGGTAGTARRPHEARGLRHGPQTAPVVRPADRPSRPKTTTQAKARAKARKAKAPTIVRPSLRERLIVKLEGVDLRPQVLLARIPFVMLVIGALAFGLGVTLWLSTASAERSYQLGSAREVNNALAQQKEALERDVLEAQSAPALADSARNLGMIPSRDTAHLVQDPAGNWVVIGMPKPAQGAPPPPLNTKLPDPTPPAPPKPVPPVVPPSKPGAFAEVPIRVAPSTPGAAVSGGVPAMAAPEVSALVPSVMNPGGAHAPGGAALPGPPSLLGSAAVPLAGDTLVTTPAAPAALPGPTVTAVPAVPGVPAAPGVAIGVVPAGPVQ